jgi:hypothetical protein
VRSSDKHTLKKISGLLFVVGGIVLTFWGTGGGAIAHGRWKWIGVAGFLAEVACLNHGLQILIG